VAMMGGLGVGSNPDLLRLRLSEEFLAQRINEKILLWRILQLIFRGLYHPYKTCLVPRFQKDLRPWKIPPGKNGQD
jgi:hypothetical protein